MKLVLSVALALSLCLECAAQAASGDSSVMLNLRMDAGSGDILLDASGFHNHAKAVDAKWKFDKDAGRKALAFDGEKSFCFFNAPLSGQSVAIWFKAEAPNAEKGFLIHSAGRFWTGRASRFRYGIFIDKDMRLGAVVGGNHSQQDLPVFKSLSSKTPAPAGVWSLCVLILDKKEISLHLNGKLVDKQTHGYMFVMPAYTTIGALYSDYSDKNGAEAASACKSFFKGFVGAVFVYDRVLSEAEAAALFKKGLPR